jgi:hypothetical protein
VVEKPEPVEEDTKPKGRTKKASNKIWLIYNMCLNI